MRQAVSFESIGKGTVLRLATCTRENHLDTTAALYFAHLVQEKTEGQIQVQVIPNGELELPFPDVTWTLEFRVITGRKAQAYS